MPIHLRTYPYNHYPGPYTGFLLPPKEAPLRWHRHPRGYSSSDYWNFLKEKSPHVLISTVENACQPRGHPRVFTMAPPEGCKGQGHCKALFSFSL